MDATTSRRAAASARTSFTPATPPPRQPASRRVHGDRFIPSRSGSNLSLFHIPTTPTGSAASPYCKLLSETLFGGSGTATPASSASPSAGTGRNTFRFKDAEALSSSAKRTLFAGGDNGDKDALVTRRRKVPSSPYKILDAPGLLDDPCLNGLLDWSSSHLAVGLGSSVHLLSFSGHHTHSNSSRVTTLCDLGGLDDDDKVCSVGWAQHGTQQLAIGTDRGGIQIWDAARCKRIRTMESSHQLRVGALAWNSSSLLSSGSGDGNILHQSPRHPCSEGFRRQPYHRRAQIGGVSAPMVPRQQHARIRRERQEAFRLGSAPRPASSEAQGANCSCERHRLVAASTRASCIRWSDG